MTHVESIKPIAKLKLKLQCWSLVCYYSDAYILPNELQQLQEEQQMLMMQTNQQTKEIKK